MAEIDLVIVAIQVDSIPALREIDLAPNATFALVNRKSYRVEGSNAGGTRPNAGTIPATEGSLVH